jgi:hypothetical protein
MNDSHALFGGLLLLYFIYAIGMIIIAIGSISAFYFLLLRPAISHWHKEAAKHRDNIFERENILGLIRSEVRDEIIRKG